jgi:hypothetical protein
MPELPLAALGATRIEAVIVDATLSAAVSHQGDLERAREAVPALVAKIQQPL